MLAFLLLAASSLDPFLASLAGQARTKARASRAAFKGPTSYAPGHHDFGAITFTLRHPLIGSVTPTVSGYAVGRSVLAVISPSIAPDTTFVDSDTQAMFHVVESFERDGDVTFYRVLVANPLSVFTNLRMRSAFDPTQKHNCSFNKNGYSGAACELRANLNWDYGSDRPKPETIVPGIDFFLGAMFDVVGSVDLSFHGITHVSLTYSLDAIAKAGIGFDIRQNYTYERTITPKCFPIYGFDIQILGVQLAIALEGCVGIGLKSFKLMVPKPLSYYRNLSVSVSRSGSIFSHSDTGTPWNYNLQTNLDANFKPSEVFNILEATELSLTPEVQLGIRITIDVGVLNYECSAGAALDTTWAFTFNADKCTSPYLYGGLSTSLTAYVSSGDLVVLKYRLLKAKSWTFQLVNDWRAPLGCIFSSAQSVEGNSSLLFDDDDPRVIVSTFDFGVKPPTTGLFPFRPSLQGLANGGVVSDLQLPTIHWKFAPFHTQSSHRDGNFILAPNRQSGQFKAVQTFAWIPKTHIVAMDLTPGRHKANLGNPGYLDYTVTAAQHVATFKEFSGKKAGVSLISFQPDVLVGAKVGAITHTIDGQQYAASMLAQVFDDATTTSRSGDYVARNQLYVEIVSFTPRWANDVNITFLRNGTTELKVAYKSGMAIGTSYSAADLDMASGALLDMDGNPSLTVRVEYNGGRTGTETWPISVWNPGKVFTLTSSLEGCDLILNCTRRQPTVVFGFNSPLGPNSRAIVCRALESSPTGQINVSMVSGERYGILRFLRNNLPPSGNVTIVVSMPGMQPLCQCRSLDDRRFLIVLAAGQTRFGNDVHIPFRRQADAELHTTAKIDAIFLTVDDAQCGDGVNISGSNGFSVGCIESIASGHTFYLDWVGLPGPLSHSTIISDTWQLHLFSAVRSGIVQVVPSAIDFPENATALRVPANLSRAFINNRQTPLAIRCDRANRLKVIDTNGSVMVVEKGVNGRFPIVPVAFGDVQAVAQCSGNNEVAFCEFQLSFPADGLTLVKYASSAGVNEVDYDGPGKLLPGVTRQVIPPRATPGVWKAWKAWEGQWEESLITKPDVLLFIINPTNVKQTTLTLKLGEFSIPFSAQKYYEDPDAFFVALGIQKPESGYSPDVVTFTEDGDVVVDLGFLNMSMIEQKAVQLESVVDVPRRFVNETDVKVIELEGRGLPESAQGEIDKRWVAGIIGIGVGCLIAVVLLAVAVRTVVARCRSQDEVHPDIIVAPLVPGTL